ncbi:MFS transporter [Geovibrio thiophilus]|uniref:MFS transporter n=2 Tax=Geovibrio thiophilus TaxID=139438 RepID=A0A410JYT6_9BACT|nr:MFS transporter [Geovibrio thiophilus]QAR33289.1 MFS transporter [Geovibrio thiophilus]
MRNNMQKRRFIILFTINFFITLAFAANDSLFPLFYNKYYSQGLTFGFAFAFYAASKILFSPLAGSIIDRYGSRIVLFFALVLFTTVSLMFCLVHGAKIILILRALQGIACAMFRPVMYCLLEFSEKQRGKTLGIFDLSFYSAVAAAPFTGSVIVENFGFGYLFLFIILCCCFCIFLVFFIGENKKNEPIYDKKQSQVFKKTEINTMMIYIFCRAWGISAVTVFLPIYLSGLSVSVKGIGLALSLSALLTAVFLPFTGRLADYFHKEILIVCGGLAVSSLLIATVLLNSYVYILAVLLFSGIFSAVSQPACLAFLMEQSESAVHGSILGHFNMFMGLGFACSPVFSSILFKYAGIKSVFIFSGLMGIVSTIVFFLMRTGRISAQSMSAIGNEPADWSAGKVTGT